MIFLASIVSCLVLNHAIVAVSVTALPFLSKHSGESDSIDGVTFAPISTIEGWAEYSPVYPVGIYTEPPKGCDLTQVNILKRHGARFPTTGDSKDILSAVNKLQTATSYTEQSMQFIKNYTYELGAEDLVPLGAKQSFIGGERAYTRYHHLVSHDNIPFVRSTGSQRVVDSAHNWTAGFSSASRHHFNPVLSVTMAESSTSNDTLNDGSCPLQGSSDAKDVFLNIFATPIANQLNSQAPGMSTNLTAKDADHLLSLCAFESVFKEELSPWCHIFGPEDFANFEWEQDLGKYYGNGYGQTIGGRVQGVGYVNELLARLTNSPVRDETQTNRTLDSNPATFPLNRVIYADFSHDSQIISIVTAMGLLNQTHEVLSDTERNPNTIWDMSDVVPFSGEVVIERLSCAQHGHKPSPQDEYVRLFINDAQQPLEFCGADKDGLCTLSKFVESQSYARNNGEGDFQKCFPQM